MFCISLQLNAQFPAPAGFNYTLTYYSFEQWGVCNGRPVVGPCYCSYFYWRMPDTLLTESTLDHFEIFNNFDGKTSMIISLEDTSMTSSDAYEGYLYVVAVYTNPDGRSEPSDSTFIPGIPIGTENLKAQDNFTIRYYSPSGLLHIASAEPVKSVRIINSLGQIVMSDNIVHSQIYIGGFSRGIYFVELTCSNKKTYSTKIFKE